MSKLLKQIEISLKFEVEASDLTIYVGPMAPAIPPLGCVVICESGFKKKSKFKQALCRVYQPTPPSSRMSIERDYHDGGNTTTPPKGGLWGQRPHLKSPRGKSE